MASKDAGRRADAPAGGESVSVSTVPEPDAELAKVLRLPRKRVG